MIPLANLDLSAQVESEIKNAINSVIKSEKFILGSHVDSFEKKFAHFIGTKYAVGVANGTDALRIAIRSIGIKNGDKILTSAFTSPFTALAITAEGAIPVFCDIDKDTWTIDPKDAEKKIDKNTKAIIPVHILGNPADMDQILLLAKKYELLVIEDACQAHGAIYKNKKVGSLGNAAAFSFYPTKNLGALGDAGIITTNDIKTTKMAKILRNGGQTKRFWHEYEGTNSRLDEIQAAILKIKLRYLDGENQKRAKSAKIYQKQLGDLPIQFQKVLANSKPSHQLMVIRTDNRDRLSKFLKKRGVSSDVYYPFPVYQQPAFRKFMRGELKVTEELCQSVLAIPIYPSLQADGRDFVVKSIRNFFGK